MSGSKSKTQVNEGGTENVKVERQQPEGKMPVLGAEGGVLEEGTGDFAADAPKDSVKSAEAGDGETTVQDRSGNDVVVKLGYDGENPISPDNPPAKALLGGGNSKPGSEDQDDPKNDENEGK